MAVGRGHGSVFDDYLVARGFSGKIVGQSLVFLMWPRVGATCSIDSCIPTFTWPSSFRKPGLRKQFTSRKGAAARGCPSEEDFRRRLQERPPPRFTLGQESRRRAPRIERGDVSPESRAYYPRKPCPFGSAKLAERAEEPCG